MKIAHILRKYHPREWAGTETVLKELIESFQKKGVGSSLYCPAISPEVEGPFEQLGIPVNRFSAFLPILGISRENRERLISVGGNLMSLDLKKRLEQQRDLTLIHCHTLGLLGAVSQKAAKKKGIPFIVSIHGGVLDLPQESLHKLITPAKGGFPWGKLFSLYYRPDKLLPKADAIVVYNRSEEKLLKERYPASRVAYVPHGIAVEQYQAPQKKVFDFPYLLVSARIDPVKNQLQLIESLPDILKVDPRLKAVFAGPVTDEAYFQQIKRKIDELDLKDACRFTGPFPYNDPRLISLYRHAEAVLLPSIAEPFGRVILEAWAAHTPVIASKTSGAKDLIRHGETGWLFSLDKPDRLVEGVQSFLKDSSLSETVTQQAWREVQDKYSVDAVADNTLALYRSLR